MTVRVIQWATGPVGSAQLREIIDNPDLELVGVFAYSPAKAGVDAGTLADRAPTNVTVTGDKSAILALDADVVLACRVKGRPRQHQHRRHREAAGQRQERDHHHQLQPPAHLRHGSHAESRNGLQAIRSTISRCRRTSRLHVRASGHHPHRTVATRGPDHRFGVRRLLGGIAEGHARRPDGDGQEPGRHHRRRTDVPGGLDSSTSRRWPRLPTFCTCRSTRSARAIETATADHDVPVAFGALAAGTVVAQKLSWTAHHRGIPVLVAEEYWTVTRDIVGWADLPDEQFLVRIRVDGSPPIRLDLTIDNDPLDELVGSSGGQLVVAMTAVRAIPYVLQAPPGIVARRPYSAPTDGIDVQRNTARAGPRSRGARDSLATHYRSALMDNR